MTEAEERAVIIAELALTYPMWFKYWKECIAPKTIEEVPIDQLRDAQRIWAHHARHYRDEPIHPDPDT